MTEKWKQRPTTRSETIRLRATQEQKALIDGAAAAQGRSRSDFVLEIACHAAESVLLDRRYFVLSGAAFRRFSAMLERPAKDNPKLRRLLETSPPWSKRAAPQREASPAARGRKILHAGNE
jgi:uncharacterized protein (DUF1778 family)